MDEHKDGFQEDSAEESLEEIIKDFEMAGDAPEEETIATPKARRQGIVFIRSKTTYYALLAIFASVFLLSAIYLGGYFFENQQATDEYDQLASIRDNATEETQASSAPDTTGSTESTEPSQGPIETKPPVMLTELSPIYQLNNDLIGWIKMDGVKVNHPVMQRPSDDDYYLTRDFYHNESIAGCMYVPMSCDVNKPSDNVVIYGHTLKTGAMFGKLSRYRNKSFWENNQTFTFDTLYERHTYQVFAVFKTAGKQFDDNGNVWGYPYHRMNEFESEEAFNQFIADIKGAAFKGENAYQGQAYYDTGITPTYGDKLLCLSTCEYSMKDPDGTVNGRLVVMAVRIK